MRQYYVLYKRGPAPKYAKLHPGRDAALYDREEVRRAVDFLGHHLFVEAVAVRIEDEMFNIVSFTQEAEAPQSFPLPAIGSGQPGEPTPTTK